MEKEELGNGLIVRYRHDLLGRTKEVFLPDGSSVAYEHDPAYLRSVTRLDEEGAARYTHRYTDIDLLEYPAVRTCRWARRAEDGVHQEGDAPEH